MNNLSVATAGLVAIWCEVQIKVSESSDNMQPHISNHKNALVSKLNYHRKKQCTTTNT